MGIALSKHFTKLAAEPMESGASHFDLFSEGDDFDPSPSELADLERRFLPDHQGPATQTSPPLWRCLKCNGSDWRWDDNSAYYVCQGCHGDEFYNASQPVKHQTAEGTWMFVPHASASQSVQDDVHAGFHGSPSPKARPGFDPPAWSYEGEGREQAESERNTHDPCVDPEHSNASSSSRRRRRRRTTAQISNQPGVPEQDHPAAAVPHTQELLDVMRQLLNDRKNQSSSASSWNSARGPGPGLKWRGGTPPAPPKWQYSASDLRAFAKYEKRVRVWQMQIRNYMTASEAGLMLYTSLTGEAEAESEHMIIEKVNHKDGVDYILSHLREPLQQKVWFQKRKLLADFEYTARHASETVRQYINRYRRIERDLQSIGIEVSQMYDAESRGNRILERCKLSPEFQRLVLIGAGNSLEHDKICESLCLQFPDFKPTPPIFGFGGQQGPKKGHSKGSVNSSSTNASSSSASSFFIAAVITTWI